MKQLFMLAIVLALTGVRTTSAQCVESHGSPRENVEQPQKLALTH